MAGNKNELYLETGDSKVPISGKMVKKYHLSPGTRSPFTSSSIVGSHGEKSSSSSAKNDPSNQGLMFQPAGATPDEDGAGLTPSEIIDFSQGADS